MKCKYCGIDLHPSADRCWKCGRGLTVTAEENDKQVALTALDPEMNKAFDALAEAQLLRKGRESLFSEEQRALLVPLAQEAKLAEVLAAQQSRKPKIVTSFIRWLRQILGEDPEPAVISSNMKNLLRRLQASMLAVAAGLISIVVGLVFAVSDSGDDDWIDALYIGGIIFIGGMGGLLHFWLSARTRRRLRKHVNAVTKKNTSRLGGTVTYEPGQLTCATCGTELTAQTLLCWKCGSETLNYTDEVKAQMEALRQHRAEQTGNKPQEHARIDVVKKQSKHPLLRKVVTIMFFVFLIPTVLFLFVFQERDKGPLLEGLGVPLQWGQFTLLITLCLMGARFVILHFDEDIVTVSKHPLLRRTLAVMGFLVGAPVMYFGFTYGADGNSISRNPGIPLVMAAVAGALVFICIIIAHAVVRRIDGEEIFSDE
jgi:hypothetical protein